MTIEQLVQELEIPVYTVRFYIDGERLTKHYPLPGSIFWEETNAPLLHGSIYTLIEHLAMKEHEVEEAALNPKTGTAYHIIYRNGEEIASG